VSTDRADILTTGGTGLVGRSIVRRLLAAGRKVRVISRGADSASHPGVVICRGDFTVRSDLQAAMQGCDAVFHCAAEKRDARDMTAVNVDGTRQLLEIATELRIEFLCYLSSVGVIGKTRAAIVDEDSACRPMTAYGRTKLAAERILGRGLAGGRVVILRPTNVFGPETLQPWLENSIRNRLRLFLKGRERSHLVYVEDIAAVAEHCLRVPSSQNVETFIVSSDEELAGSNAEVQGALATMLESAPGPGRVSLPLAIPHCLRLLRDGGSNIGSLIYSAGKLRRAGVRLPYGLRGGLNDVVEAWRNRRTNP
jgi:nucleoside-diphosphate-sugar epimerase